MRAKKPSILFLAAIAALLTAEVQSAETAKSYVELSAKNVDGISLLHTVAAPNAVDFIATPGGASLINFPARALEIDAIWRDIVGRLRMKEVSRNGFRIVVPECRNVAAPSAVSPFPPGEKITLSYSSIPSEQLYKLLAENMGLGLRLPDGLRDTELAIHATNRLAREVLPALDSALAMQSQTAGGTLVVIKSKGNRGCDDADAKRWRFDVKLEPNVTEMLRRNEKVVRAACPRIIESGAKVADCTALESVPLSRIMMRGYLRLSPTKPFGALLEAADDPNLYWANPGERVDREQELLNYVGSRHMEVVDMSEEGKIKPARRKEMNRNFVSKTHAYFGGRVLSKREFLESYDMRDLLLTKTEQVGGRWQATITDPNGIEHTMLPGRYLGGDDGRVTTIGQDTLTLVEIRADGRGGYVEHSITLRTNVPYVEPRDVIRDKYTAPMTESKLQTRFVLEASKGNKERVEQMLLDGANIDSTYAPWGENALIAAVRENQYEVVDLLLRKGARPNLFAGVDEQTPLHIAATVDRPLLVSRLLKAGADPNISDLGERLPIHYAVSEGNVATVKMLAEAKSKLNYSNGPGITPFTSAAVAGNWAMVQLFLANGVKVNDVDRAGNTMLHAAVWGKKSECARKLIELGADVNKADSDGKRPLDTAREREDAAMVELLLSKGAKGTPPK